MYDPLSDQWEAGPELPTPLWEAQAVSWGGELLLLGGVAWAGAGFGIINDKVWRLAGAGWEETGITVPGGTRRTVFPAPIVTNEQLQCTTK